MDISLIQWDGPQHNSKWFSESPPLINWIKGASPPPFNPPHSPAIPPSSPAIDMRCYELISGIGSDSRFSFPSTHSILLDSSSRLPFNPLPSINPAGQSRHAACLRARARATVSDEFLAESESESVAVSFYELLGISESGTLYEIKQAYKSLARKYHPDVSPPGRVKEYTRRFIQVQEAYETLSDPHRRALYDRDLAMGLHLAFSARKFYHRDQEVVGRNEWRNQWEGQLSELKRRSMHRDAAAATGGNMSWGARMRMQRNKASSTQEYNV